MRKWGSLCLLVVTMCSFDRASAQRALAIADLLRAAAHGNVQAELMLGVAYEFGRGVTQDFNAAAHWYGKAADAGDSHAQTLLGNLYAHGRGVLEDQATAFKWYMRAAVDGDSAAQTNVGFMYFAGAGGVNRDYTEAARWFQKAAANTIRWPSRTWQPFMKRGWACHRMRGRRRTCTWKRQSKATCTRKEDWGGSTRTGSGGARIGLNQ